MSIYRGFTINDSQTVKPWGLQEERTWKALIDTLVTNTLQGTSSTSGHSHNKLYGTSGGVVVLSASPMGNIIIPTAKVSIGSTSAVAGLYIKSDTLTKSGSTTSAPNGFSIVTESKNVITGTMTENGISEGNLSRPFKVMGGGILSGGGVYPNGTSYVLLNSRMSSLSQYWYTFQGMLEVHLYNKDTVETSGSFAYVYLNLSSHTYSSINATQDITVIDKYNYNVANNIADTFNVSVDYGTYDGEITPGFQEIRLYFNFPRDMYFYYKFDGVVFDNDFTRTYD